MSWMLIMFWAVAFAWVGLLSELVVKSGNKELILHAFLWFAIPYGVIAA